MPQALENPPLELESVAAPDIVRSVHRQNLERDKPSLRQIARQVDVAHAAMTEDLLDGVAADCRAWLQWRAGH
jgi:hypothetical protein